MSSSVLRNVIQPKHAAPSLNGKDGEGSLLERPVEEMETILGVLIENAPVAMAMFDHQMRYLLANRTWMEEFSLQGVQPLIGRSQYEVFPGMHPGWRQVYDRALQGHVVRSEHDALSGPDGRRVVYRWEVRPWRRKKDAAVGGLMVTCEKFGNAAAFQAVPSAEGVAEPSEKEAAAPALVDSTLPIVMVDDHGIIRQTNATAAELGLARGIQEGASPFWEVYADARDSARVQLMWGLALEKLAGECRESGWVMEVPPMQSQTSSGASQLPAQRWLITRCQPGDGRLFLAVKLPAAALPAPAPAAAAAPQPTASAASTPNLSAIASAVASISQPLAENPGHLLEMRRLQEELARARQELRTLHEAEKTFAGRETRMRQYLDSLPCGALVLDERGTPVYQNEPLTKLLGRAVRTDETVENWLGAACPNDEHRQEIATLWREDVWRRQLTRIFSLATADGLLKELEFQPASLPGGGLLVCIQDATEPCRQEEQLRATEAKFRTLLHECPLPAVLVDKSGAVFEANHPAEILCGRSKADLRRLPLDSWLGEADAAARRRLLQQVVADGERSASLPVQLLHAEGHPVQVTLTLAPVLDARGAPHCAIHFFQKTEPSPAPAVLALPAALSNATAMSAAPQGLTASAFYQEVAATQSFEIREQSLLRTNVNGRIREITPRGLELLGLAEEEARGRALHLHFRPSDPSGFYSELGRLAQSGNAETEMACYTRQGDRQTCTLRVVSCGGGGLDFELTEVASVPVFEQAHAQVTAPAGAPWPLADLSREKLLLSETHHRIKNHLQIISSLLNLESNSIQDEGARCALRSSQNRVRAIAELHQHLYQVALGTAEDFSVFAEGLVQRLRACYQVPAGQVAVKLELEEGGIQQEWLMPLALTLNETLSNCFEHAFPEGRTGAVTVMLNFADGAGLLTVKDDGCGFPEGFEGAASPGLGLKIMGVFAEQMNGSLHYAPVQSGGVEVRLFFPLVASGS